MNADGSNQARLTDNAPGCEHPSFSPDGQKIVFNYYTGNNPEIYSMNTDGSNLVRLTNDDIGDYMPAYSPDGQNIICSSDSGVNICTINHDGSNKTYLTSDMIAEQYPSFSPDGNKIVFDAWFGMVGINDLDIMIMNIDGTNKVKLTDNSAYNRKPSFSLDGSRIAFYSNHDGNNDIYVMDIDGSNPVRVTNDAASDQSPSWGPSAPSSSDTTPPITTCTSSTSTDPSGWFTITPSITMSRNESGSTYYRWEFNSSWTTYSTPFNAPEGQHTLYYYSKDTSNNTELVKSKSFKVDIGPPSTPTNVKAIPMSSSQIGVSWNAATDDGSGIAGYKVFCKAYDADAFSQIATTTATSFSHAGLNTNSTYSYFIKAFDGLGNVSNKSDTKSATTYQVPAPTPLGTDIPVDLGNNLGLTFSEITNPGTTSVTVSYDAPSPLPGGFSHLGYYYDVSTTASFEGTVTATFPYDDSQMTSQEEKNLRLFHYEGGEWRDVTVLPVDTVGNTITGQVSSLSPFVVVTLASSPGGPGGGSSSVPSSSTWSLILIGLSAIGIVRRFLKV